MAMQGNTTVHSRDKFTMSKLVGVAAVFVASMSTVGIGQALIHNPCHICPSGQVVVNPEQKTSLGAGFSLRQNHVGASNETVTCSDAEAYSQAGCFDDVHCAFLQGFLGSACCGSVASSDGASSSIPPATTCPVWNANTEAKCFLAEIAGGLSEMKFCVENLFDFMCIATLNGKACNSCSSFGAMCPGLSDFFGTEGDTATYKVDCSNLNTQLGSLQICGDKVSTAPSYDMYSGHSTYHSRSRSNGNSGDPLGGVFFWIGGIFYVFARVACRVSNAQNRRREIQRTVDYRPVITSVELTDMANAPTATATLVGTATSQPAVVVTTASATDDSEVPMVTAQPVTAQRTKRRRYNATALDLIAQDPLARKILAEARVGKIDTFMVEIENFRGPMKWDLRAKYMLVASENLVVDEENQINWNELVSVHQQSSPGLAAAIRVIQGDHLIDCAWDARGSGWASTVNAEAAVRFKALLEAARDALLEASTLDIEDPTPFALLQTIGMGLSGRPAAERWLQQSRQRDKFNFETLNRHRYLLMKKWHGRHDRESLAFALSISQEAPAHHLIQLILIKAMYDQYIDGAWTDKMRQSLIREPWVATKTLNILRSVYADQQEPPVNTLFEKILFRVMIKWIDVLVQNKVMPSQTRTQALAILSNAQRIDIV